MNTGRLLRMSRDSMTENGDTWEQAFTECLIYDREYILLKTTEAAVNRLRFHTNILVNEVAKEMCKLPFIQVLLPHYGRLLTYLDNISSRVLRCVHLN